MNRRSFLQSLAAISAGIFGGVKLAKADPPPRAREITIIKYKAGTMRAEELQAAMDFNRGGSMVVYAMTGPNEAGWVSTMERML